MTRHDEALQTIVGFVLGVFRQLLTWLGRDLQVFVDQKLEGLLMQGAFRGVAKGDRDRDSNR